MLCIYVSTLDYTVHSIHISRAVWSNTHTVPYDINHGYALRVTWPQKWNNERSRECDWDPRRACASFFNVARAAAAHTRRWLIDALLRSVARGWDSVESRHLVRRSPISSTAAILNHAVFELCGSSLRSDDNRTTRAIDLVSQCTRVRCHAMVRLC